MRLLSTFIIIIIIITDGCVISAHPTRNDITNDVIALREATANDVTRSIKLLETLFRWYVALFRWYETLFRWYVTLFRWYVPLFRWYVCKKEKEKPVDRRNDGALEMKVSYQSVEIRNRPKLINTRTILIISSHFGAMI